MELVQLYHDLFYAIKEGTIEAIQKAAYLYFQNPIAISDTAFHLMAKDYPDINQNDEIWDIPNKTLTVPYEHLLLYYEHNLIETVISHPNETILLNWGWFKQHPRITTAVLVDNKVVAYIAVLLKSDTYPKEFDEALQIVSSAFSIIIANRSNQGFEYLSERELISRELFYNQLTDERIKSAIAKKYIIPRKFYQIIAARYSPYQKDFDDITDIILLHDILYIIDEDTLFIFTSCDNENSNDYIIKILKNNNYSCGISYPFIEITDIERYKKQALESLNIGKKNHNHVFVNYFNDYSLDILINNCKHINLYIHPILDSLRKHDINHKTDYYNTLKTYINHYNNLEECFEILNIHRNTLTYRLKKIEELFDIDLSLEFTIMHLYLSYLIINYLTKE